ncbi:hypothetical protein ABW19_dt0201435 [Dactylella cylindrospora]|nr:hypothetical protein ABW19_dt0201435 [Dactylella cylindrospora]
MTKSRHRSEFSTFCQHRDYRLRLYLYETFQPAFPVINYPEGYLLLRTAALEGYKFARILRRYVKGGDGWSFDRLADSEDFGSDEEMRVLEARVKGEKAKTVEEGEKDIRRSPNRIDGSADPLQPSFPGALNPQGINNKLVVTTLNAMLNSTKTGWKHPVKISDSMADKFPVHAAFWEYRRYLSQKSRDMAEGLCIDVDEDDPDEDMTDDDESDQDAAEICKENDDGPESASRHQASTKMTKSNMNKYQRRKEAKERKRAQREQSPIHPILASPQGMDVQPVDLEKRPTSPSEIKLPRSRNPLNRPDEWLQRFYISRSLLKWDEYFCPNSDDCENDHIEFRKTFSRDCLLLTITKYFLKLLYFIHLSLAYHFYTVYTTLSLSSTRQTDLTKDSISHYKKVCLYLLVSAYAISPIMLVFSRMDPMYRIMDEVHGLKVSGTWRFPRRVGCFALDLAVGSLGAAAFFLVWGVV